MANRIKMLREAAQEKQRDLAHLLNVSQGTLSNWERGIHDPDNDVLILIANHFNVTVDYVLGNKTAPKREVPPDERMVLLLKQNLNRIGIGAPDRDLTDEELRALTEFINNNRDLIIWRAKQITEGKDK